MTAFLLCTLLTAAAPPDTVVVVPPAYREALQPWLDHRQAQGHELAVLTAWDSANDIRRTIRDLSKRGNLRSVVLVGDVPTDPRQAAASVPTFRVPSVVIRRWDSEPEIATDNPYVDLDEDQLPDLAVGRLTADSPAELQAMVRKILAYEQSAPHGVWQRRLNVVAGVGGFGPIVDPLLENTTKRFLTDSVPAEYQVSMTYGSWRSPFCPDPRHFQETAIRRFNEGCLFWVYLGHGQRTFLDRVRVPGGTFPILDTDAMPRLQAGDTLPIAVFLACYAGAFDGPRDCLAEAMLEADQGPVATLAGSRVTMPYAMAVMGHELLQTFFVEQPPTLGELVRQAKCRMAAEQAADKPGGDFNRRLLDTLAAVVSPAPDALSEERREHVLLFNLLGDPLLRLRHGEAIQLETPRDVIAGQALSVSCLSKVSGRAKLELVCRRDRWKEEPLRRTRFIPTEMALAGYAASYRAANDRLWVTREVQLHAGELQTEIPVPENARGPCFLRIFVEGADGHAKGSSYVFVRRPPKTAPAAKPLEIARPMPSLPRS